MRRDADLLGAAAGHHNSHNCHLAIAPRIAVAHHRLTLAKPRVRRRYELVVTPRATTRDDWLLVRFCEIAEAEYRTVRAEQWHQPADALAGAGASRSLRGDGGLGGGGAEG